ncbi:hypothetical protein KP803_00680 [Vibrio sp. ZSDE26]|uniref:Lipoprotein n=1 Tax=Vibrio amylolyticus TaxID=2847292 RepID=A0A9X1XEZ3_9VIBR|nr:hypothetical protein [Vibrio amylolyticus]MCK6261782.1 hypothetical protein [Vibrio amylolyticus]
MKKRIVLSMVVALTLAGCGGAKSTPSHKKSITPTTPTAPAKPNPNHCSNNSIVKRTGQWEDQPNRDGEKYYRVSYEFLVNACNGIESASVGGYAQENVTIEPVFPDFVVKSEGLTRTFSQYSFANHDATQVRQIERWSGTLPRKDWIMSHAHKCEVNQYPFNGYGEHDDDVGYLMFPDGSIELLNEGPVVILGVRCLDVYGGEIYSDAGTISNLSIRRDSNGNRFVDIHPNLIRNRQFMTYRDGRAYDDIKEALRYATIQENQD